MVTIFFAPPGVGKSTLAARFAWLEWLRSKFHRNKYSKVFCNFPCKHTFEFNKYDFGFVDMRGLILVDELGIDYNNRRYKDLPQETIQFLKLHRHYASPDGKPTDIIGFSQSYTDMDVTIRRLCTRMYLLKRCWFWPYTTKALRITKSIGIDENTHDIVDSYQFDNWFLRIFTTKRFYMPLYWHMFDSWSAPTLSKGHFKEHR